MVHPLAPLAFAVALAGCAAPAVRQTTSPPPPSEPRTQAPRQGTAAPSTSAPAPPQRRTDVSLAFSSDAGWLDTRTTLSPQTYLDAGVFFTDDEVLADVGLLRVGRPSETSPLEIGAGVGVYGGLLDDPLDYVVAIPLKFYGSYTFQIGFPLRVVGNVAYAPDITTFVDGDSLLDARVSAELELTPQATVVVGYRYYEIGVDDRRDVELIDGLLFGVRLGF
ncbi:MAG: YfaZ family outer membrane protein [Planctomycetota bacterium]